MSLDYNLLIGSRRLAIQVQGNQDEEEESLTGEINIKN